MPTLTTIFQSNFKVLQPIRSIQVHRATISVSSLYLPRSARMSSSTSTPQKYWWEQESSSAADLEASLPSRRIHFLGVGPIGLLVAHSLASLPNDERPPITLLLHRPGLLDDFRSQNQQIRVIRNADGQEDVKGGFDVDVLTNPTSKAGNATQAQHGDSTTQAAGSSDTTSPRQVGQADPMGGSGLVTGYDAMEKGGSVVPAPENPKWESVSDNFSSSSSSTNDDGGRIDALILTTKAAATVSAIQSVRHRLRPSSTVLFIQNGMGQLDEVNEQVFPDPSTRPHYMQGIISHALWMKEPFIPVHAGIGNLSVGMIPSSSSSTHNPSSPSSTPSEKENALWPPTSRHLLRTLLLPALQNPLHTSPLPSPTLLTSQLLKLSMNCINNSLTPLLDIPNGHQLSNPHLSSTVIPLLISEISSIILRFPELTTTPTPNGSSNSTTSDGPSVDPAPFQPQPLEEFTRRIINMARKNSSSSREDVRKGRETELRYINGYLIKRGRELGADTRLNQLVLALVEARGLEVRGVIEDPE